VVLNSKLSASFTTESFKDIVVTASRNNREDASRTYATASIENGCTTKSWRDW
jgi:hypothetical protein